MGQPIISGARIEKAVLLDGKEVAVLKVTEKVLVDEALKDLNDYRKQTNRTVICRL